VLFRSEKKNACVRRLGTLSLAMPRADAIKSQANLTNSLTNDSH